MAIKVPYYVLTEPLWQGSDLEIGLFMAPPKADWQLMARLDNALKRSLADDATPVEISMRAALERWNAELNANWEF